MLAGRFPLGYGVAGRVAQTGETLNLVDAYRSKYFSPSVDQATVNPLPQIKIFYFFSGKENKLMEISIKLLGPPSSA